MKGSVSSYVYVAGLFLVASTQCLSLEVDREVMPRITVGGKAIANIDIKNKPSTEEHATGMNISDSSLGIRFDKKLFYDGVGGATLAFKETSSSNTALIWNEMNAFYWSDLISAVVGRTKLPNSLLELPVLRDEDLLAYAFIGNGASNEENDTLYGKTLWLTWYVDRKNQGLEFWATEKSNETGLEYKKGFNDFGIGYTYQPAEDVKYIQYIRHAGIRLARQSIKQNSNSRSMTALLAGIEFNFSLDPQYNWAMAFQGIHNNGISGITSSDISDQENGFSNQSKAKSTAFVASLMYTNRAMLLTRWQAALTTGYKRYPDIDGGTQYSIIPSFVYRLGIGFDVVSQINYTKFDRGLYNKKKDVVYQLGLAFDFDMHFNKTFTGRNSIINLTNRFMKS